MHKIIYKLAAVKNAISSGIGQRSIRAYGTPLTISPDLLVDLCEWPKAKAIMAFIEKHDKQLPESFRKTAFEFYTQTMKRFDINESMSESDVLKKALNIKTKTPQSNRAVDIDGCMEIFDCVESIVARWLYEEYGHMLPDGLLLTQNAIDNFKVKCAQHRLPVSRDKGQRQFTGKYANYGVSVEVPTTMTKPTEPKPKVEPELTVRDRVLKMSDKELEIFVRERLGQKNASLCEPKKDHLRFDFHAVTPKAKAHNYKVLSLFEDVMTDTNVSITSIKGSFHVHDYCHSPSFDQSIDCSGWGTVEIIMMIIKRPKTNKRK